MMLVGIVVVALFIALIGGLYAYGSLKFNQIQRTTVRKGILVRPEVGLPVNILLVGSDSRAAFTGKDKSSFGDASQVEGQRSDTMMLVHVDPRTGGVSVLSIPRDLWVPIAEVGTEDKINQAFDGGPSRLISTVQSALGVRINHYAEVDFSGFRSVVNAVDGVTIWLPYPARDSITGLDLPNAGCVPITGEQALAYVRSRHYQQLRNGKWRTDPTSDFGRIKRQQGFIRYTLRKVKASGSLSNIDALVSSLVKTITLDSAFSRKEVTTLARRFRGLAPETIRTFVLPTTADTVGKQQVLRLDTAKANDVINRFNGFLGAGSMRPDRVTLQIREAWKRSTSAQSDTTGISEVPLSDIAARLTTLGFPDVGMSQSPAAALVRTQIRHRPESLDKARYVAAFLVGGADLVEDTSLNDVDLEVRIGNSYAGIREKPIGLVGPKLADNDDAASHPCNGAADPGLDARTAAASTGK